MDDRFTTLTNLPCSDLSFGSELDFTVVMQPSGEAAIFGEVITGFKESTLGGPYGLESGVAEGKAGARTILLRTTQQLLLGTGRNEYGQLSAASTRPEQYLDEVVRVGPNEEVRDFDISYDKAVAVTAKGHLFSWGLNEIVGGLPLYNESGLFNYTYPPLSAGCSSTPRQISKEGFPSTFRRAKAGESFAVAVTEQGEVFTWGENGCGQLGQPIKLKEVDVLSIVLPIRLSSFGSHRPVAELSVGRAHVLVLVKDGVLFSWGSNSHRQTGHGTALVVGSPTELFKDVRLISAGHNSSGFVTRGEQLYTFGDNSRGQLFAPPSEKRALTMVEEGLPTGLKLSRLSKLVIGRWRSALLEIV